MDRKVNDATIKWQRLLLKALPRSKPGTEPICRGSTGFALKVFKWGFANLFGRSPLEWDLATCRLQSFPGKMGTLVWSLNQFLGLFGGVALILWSFSIESKEITLFHKSLWLTIFAASLSSMVICIMIWKNPKEIGMAINRSLDYHQNLINCNWDIWEQLENSERFWLTFFGIGVNIAMVVMIMAQFCSVPLTMLNMDSLKFVLESILEPGENGWILEAFFFLLRVLQETLTTHGMTRNSGFLVLFFFYTFQAYVYSLKVLQKFQDFPNRILGEYKKLKLLHGALSPFANRINATILGICHTACLGLMYLGIKGSDSVPLYISNFLGMCGLMGALLGVVILGIVSKVQLQSTTLLEDSLKIHLHRWNGRRALLRREIRVFKPICFKGGGWFVIGRSSPVEFMNTLIDNLTSALLTF